MRQLLAGESLVLPPLHRHWIMLVQKLLLPVVCGLIALVAVDGLLGFAIPDPGIKLVGTLAILSFVGVWAIVAWLQWASASLTVTDQRVILEEGIFQRTSKVIPLDRVQDVSTKQTLLGRVLDYGLVEIDAAGSGGAEVFPYVASPELLRDQVFVLSEQLRRG